MRLLNDSVHHFSHVSPIYNWIYPVAGRRHAAVYAGDLRRILGAAEPASRPRALYLHVPFCETICRFCPLVKGPLADAGTLDRYVRGLLAEIAMKARDRELTRLPIRAMFFGGGTPSLLEPHHIEAIGRALHDAFDLGGLEEFSIEMEVKSVTTERAAAFRAIGVTHARFGAQTFQPRHREALHLTAGIDQIVGAAALLKTVFPHVSCDMLYGLHGETGDELVADIEAATSLGLDNVDLYPLNIFVVQRKLHRHYGEAALAPLSGLTKLYMTQAARAIMRGKGYLPHNGHGFVKVPAAEIEADPVVTRGYAFKYHQHVYGGADDEYIGIGNSAQSYIAGRTIANEPSRNRYVESVLDRGELPVSIVEHARELNASKILAIALPYLGRVDSDRVRWTELPPGTVERLDELIERGLVERVGREIRLTHDGWLWYVNLMFYLAPREEKAAVAGLMVRDTAGTHLGARNIERLTAVQ